MRLGEELPRAAATALVVGAEVASSTERGQQRDAEVPAGADPAAPAEPSPGETLLRADLAVADGFVRTLTLNRPSSRNALDTDLIRRLSDALKEADRDGDVRAVVLKAAGTVFCAGGDVKEFAGRPDARELMVTRATHLATLLATLPQLSVPVVAAASGAAVGAGAALVLGADMIVATDGFSMSFPEFADSVVPAVVMPSLVQFAGRKLAFDLLTQGAPLTSSDALAAGLINRITPLSRLDADAQEIARNWAATDRAIVAATKQLFGRVSGLSLADGLKAGLAVTEATWQPRR